MSGDAIERIDWEAVRAMVQAPAYLQRIGVSSYESPEERVQAFGGDRLPHAEAERLNAARKRALQRQGKPEDWL